jgi:hypothetical protein
MMAQENQPKFLPAVRRARIERLDIYEISETELQILERGAPESIFLNFAIFLISISASFLVALLTIEIQSVRVFNVFIVVTVVGFTIGAVLLALWAWYRRSTTTMFAQIRRRMPPEGIPTTEIEGTTIQ